MFAIAQKPTFVWPVKFSTPADSGKFDVQTVDIEFKRLGVAAITELTSKVVTLPTGETRAQNDKEFVTEFVVGWRGIQNEDGSAFEFSPSNLETLCDIPGVAVAMSTAFFDAVRGSKAKN